jgi:hypothetical protein
MFGVMVSCGRGGVFTELIDDVVTERAPGGRRPRRAHARATAHEAPCDRFHGVAATDPAARFIARFAELALRPMGAFRIRSQSGVVASR